MKAICLLALIVLVTPRLSLCGSPTTNIGETSISLPSPKGFAYVGPEIQWLNEESEILVPPTNRQLAMFIDERELGEVLARAQPNILKHFAVQVLRKLEPLDCTTQEFVQFKADFKKKYEADFEKIRRELPQLFDKAARQLSQESAFKVALTVNGVIPLPSHEESDSSLAYSTFMKLTMNVGGNAAATEVVTVTSTLLHIRGKILFLYVFGGPDDLDWTRTAAANWVTQISDANPSPKLNRMLPPPRAAPPDPYSGIYLLYKIIFAAVCVYWVGRGRNKLGSK